MASVIKIKRSSVQGKAPTTSDILSGEIALNTRDGKLFSSDGSVVFEIGANLHSLSVGTGGLSIGNGAITFPTSDGTAGQVLKTDGNGSLYFANAVVSNASSSNTYSYYLDHKYYTVSSNTLTYNVTNPNGSILNVYLNGIKLANSDYTRTPTTVTFDASPSIGDLIELEAISSITFASGTDQYLTANSYTSNAISEQVVDTFSASSIRTAKYVVQITDNANSEYQSSEVLLIHDGSTVTFTQYGSIKTGSTTLGTVDADINSGNVRLKVTPTYSNSTIKTVRTAVTA